jgi:hypothetical protein
MKIYLICSVRKNSPEETSVVEKYVKYLEFQGHKVHFSLRDCDQTDDGIGLKICETHRAAMHRSDECHVIWNPESIGSHFDLGMAFMLQYIKPDFKIKIAMQVGESGYEYINYPQMTPNKSYTNVLRELNKRSKFIKNKEELKLDEKKKFDKNNPEDVKRLNDYINKHLGPGGTVVPSTIIMEDDMP